MARWAVTVLGALALAVLAAVAAYLGLCYATALRLLSAGHRRPFTQTPTDLGLAYESVAFRSRCDGLLLDGWLMPGQPGVTPRRPVVIVHGWKRHRQNEVGGRLLEIADHLVRRGCPVLQFDLRGWGRSEGDGLFRLGVTEVRDVGGAIDFLKRRGLADDGVHLLGYSMGGVSSLLLAPCDPLVRAVATDSAYASLNDVLRYQLPRVSRLPSIFTAGTIWMLRMRTGIDPATVRPVDGARALAANGVPLLIVHGEADSWVPIEHAHRLASAYGPGVATLFVPGAEHTLSYTVDPVPYLSRLDAFFDRAELDRAMDVGQPGALASGPLDSLSH